MHIRESTDADKGAIHALHLDAFDEEEAEAVAGLAIALIENEAAQPQLSLVAEDDTGVVGHILFTPVTLEGSDADGGYILCPLGVLTRCHGSGVGTALIRRGLEMLTEQGANFVLVYGDPNYYSRTGFAAGHGMRPPFALDFPDAWMAQGLGAYGISGIEGTVRCAAPLDTPEFW